MATTVSHGNGSFTVTLNATELTALSIDAAEQRVAHEQLVNSFVEKRLKGRVDALRQEEALRFAEHLRRESDERRDAAFAAVGYTPRFGK